jgi:hypothetical protein
MYQLKKIEENGFHCDDHKGKIGMGDSPHSLFTLT